MATAQAVVAPKASSSRRSVVSLLVAGVAVASGAAFFGLRARAPRPVTAARGPRLVWSTAPRASAAEPVSGDALATAAWLVLASLDEAAQRRTLDDVAELLDAAEAQLNPLALMLSDEPPELIRRRLRTSLLPAWTAARSLVQPSWNSGDGSLSVRLASQDEPGDTGSSVDAWSRPAPGTRAAQARFVAWAVSSALLVDAGNAQSAVALSARLRRSAQSPGSRIALVLDSSSLDVDARVLGDAQADYREIEARLLAVPEARLRRGLGSAAALALALRAGLPKPPLLGWLGLAPRELLVVPRLSAMNQREAFEASVRGLALDVTVAAP
jgi:hypothetical protein